MRINKDYRLDEIADIDISGVDKKVKDGEIPVKLCNFTDVYNNWAVTERMTKYFMLATANKSKQGSSPYALQSSPMICSHRGSMMLSMSSEALRTERSTSSWMQ